MARFQSDAELVEHVGAALEAAMEVGDYSHAEEIRMMAGQLIRDGELRRRLFDAMRLAHIDGDASRFEALWTLVKRGEGGWVGWQEPALALLAPTAEEGATSAA